ncbi:MAG TPA: trypsin-like peptidase domain-containing protein [Candidatus Nanopelagicaceae bacterium]|nr:trypsin-like peptidase domain-containing protein [Candidatus Nanopelagicaceae bacterium]
MSNEDFPQVPPVNPDPAVTPDTAVTPDPAVTPGVSATPITPWWSTPGAQASPPPPASPFSSMGAPFTFEAAPIKSPRRFGIPSVLALTLLAGGAGGAVGFTAAQNGTSLFDTHATLKTVSSVIERSPSSVAAIAARVIPSVVSITTSTPNGGGTGSGFVLRSDGYLLTNNHVVAEAIDSSGAQIPGALKVQLSDGRTFDGKIVGRDPYYDLAVVKVNVTGLTALALGNSDKIQVGDAVIAIGSPLGLSGTVTTGIISAKDRAVTTSGSNAPNTSFINALQTDAAINPGNSGGPLVDATGAVIGVNSAIASLGSAYGGQSGSIGLGFAIPINQAKRTAEELIRTGVSTHPIIGVSLTSSYAGAGAQIASTAGSVMAGSPAAKAGLKPGDVITGIDGKKVANADELIVAIRAHAPGDRVDLTYVRGQNPEVKVSLTLAASTK